MKYTPFEIKPGLWIVKIIFCGLPMGTVATEDEETMVFESEQSAMYYIKNNFGR